MDKYINDRQTPGLIHTSSSPLWAGFFILDRKEKKDTTALHQLPWTKEHNQRTTTRTSILFL